MHSDGQLFWQREHLIEKEILCLQTLHKTSMVSDHQKEDGLYASIAMPNLEKFVLQGRPARDKQQRSPPQLAGAQAEE